MTKHDAFWLVSEGWQQEMTNALHMDSSELGIVAPFIKEGALRWLDSPQPGRIRVITRYRIDDFYHGVSDISALATLLEKGAEVRGIANLHSKLYLFGKTRAVVTSANLTEKALNQNHELGLVTENPEILRDCIDYFEHLWRGGKTNLTPAMLIKFEADVKKQLEEKVPPQSILGSKDYGATVVCKRYATEADATRRKTNPPQAQRAFVKFIGNRSDPWDVSSTTIASVNGSDCHRALYYSEHKRPTGVAEGDIMFIGRITNDGDIRIFGRAIAIKHDPERDEVTEAEIEKAKEDWKWKKDYPLYNRIKDPEFFNEKLIYGVSLRELMKQLQENSFASTKMNKTLGTGNTDPEKSIRQQPRVELTNEGRNWIEDRLEILLREYGKISQSKLKNIV